MNLAMHKHQQLYMLIYRNEPEGKFLEYYSEISRLATLLETAKLHDEAKDQHGNESLSIEFFTKNKYWKDADEEWKKVKKIKKRFPTREEVCIVLINRVIFGGISVCFWTLLQNMKWTE